MPSLSLFGERFHSIVTDPPYGLGSWDWIDHPDDLHDWHQQWAKTALDCVYPGAHMAVFSGTRHFHRMMVAIEDAGWELRDTLSWLKASGMPKSRNRDAFGTGLKPGWEPIALFRKPLDGTIFENFDRYQTGMLHIDACRIATTDSLSGGDHVQRDTQKSRYWQRPWMQNPEAVAKHRAKIEENVRKAEKLGRWPANVLLDEEAAALLDEQFGDRKAGGTVKTESVNSTPGKHVYGTYGKDRAFTSYGDSGGASRFFFVSKAAPKERDFGLPEGTKNTHPTVKPIRLMQWINRLLTIPGGRILDPFVGSGSTGCAARADGFDFLGIDSDAAMAEIARQRIGAVDDHFLNRT